MSQRLIEAQEKERSWIALELHDEINQRLAGVMLQLSLLGKGLPASMNYAQTAVTAANKHLKELITDMQAMSHRLYSPSLKHIGLAQAAEGLCREFSAAQEIDIQFHSDNVSRDLPENIGLCMFRVLQEALQNLAKHSGARRGQVLLIGKPDTIELTVGDEGKGFHAEGALVGSGLGLLSMRERLKLVNGEVSIDSEPGRGTVIHARVPLHFEKKAPRWADRTMQVRSMSL